MTAAEFLFNVKPKSESVRGGRTESVHAVSISFDLGAIACCTYRDITNFHIRVLSIDGIHLRWDLHLVTPLDVTPFSPFAPCVAIADDVVCDNRLISIADGVDAIINRQRSRYVRPL